MSAPGTASRSMMMARFRCSQHCAARVQAVGREHAVQDGKDLLGDLLDGSPSRRGCRRSRSWSSQSRRSDRDAALLFQSVLLRPVRPVCRYPQAWMGSPFIRAARCVRSSSVNSAIPATRPTAACGRFVVTADFQTGCIAEQRQLIQEIADDHDDLRCDGAEQRTGEGLAEPAAVLCEGAEDQGGGERHQSLDDQCAGSVDEIAADDVGQRGADAACRCAPDRTVARRH